MDDNVVPIDRAKKGRKDNMEILLCINKEISGIDDPLAREQIRETLRKVAAKFFSFSF
jgi:hypothetical protein